MKKFLFTITSLLLVIGMLSSTGVLCFAASTPGKGLIDGEQYYIYGGTYSTHSFLHSEDSTVTNMGDVGLTSYRITTQNPWDDSRYIWTLEKQSDGTYMIEILNEKYLRIRQDGSVVIYHNIGVDGQKFEICREDNGLYTIKNGDKYLSRDSIYGTNLILVTTATECSYWTFMAAEKGIAEYYGYENGDFNTATPEDRLDGDTISDYFYSLDYYATVYTYPITSDLILDCLPDIDISIFTGQGGAGYIITDPTGGADSMIMADYELTQGSTQQYINDLGPNDLAKSRCIIYASKNSGNLAYDNDGCSYNLVDITYEKGAHFVLGFTCDMPDNLINQWMLYFLYYAVEKNYPIYLAMDYACFYTDLCETIDGVRVNEYIYYRGDGNQFLNF